MGCTSDSLNELLDAVTTFSCKDKGLRKITIDPIYESSHLLFDENVLQRLVEKTDFLDELKINNLSNLHKLTVKPLLKTICSIITNPKNNSTLTKFDFCSCSKADFKDGQMVFEALAKSNFTNLVKFSFIMIENFFQP